MRRRSRIAIVAVSTLVWSALAAGEASMQLAPLHLIPTENQAPDAIPADGPARVRLSSPNPKALAEALGVRMADDATSFEYVVDRYPQLRGDGTRTWLEPTFVIDYTEPAFEPLRKDLSTHGTDITRTQLVQYVANLIEESSDRGWDLASVVAVRRRGDCSEHAVLTAALARLRGIPARVVIGVALVSDDKRHGAFGHAWAELLEKGEWAVADAALLESSAKVRYLPIGLLEDEGLGYAVDLARLLQIWVSRVVVLGP